MPVLCLMDSRETVFLIFTITGGLALFLYGMNIMTEGLRLAAGDRLRAIIYRGTGNRLSGLGLGTLLGFLMHSSATSVMTVGFINAGLIRLVPAIPVFMGANIGTTLSMQLISFKLTDYALFAVTVGFFMLVLLPGPTARNSGRAALGFGLLFLGMELMSGAIEPHRETLLPWLSTFDGGTWSGMLLGTLAAWAFTAVIQSSGATIGMTFVLISAGVFTSLEQVLPIVLGAHLGTTTTGILASLGCGLEARRGALSNLTFNVFNVLLGMAAAPWFLAAMEKTSDDLIRQTANLHTAVMAVAALALLPLTPKMAQLMGWILRSKEPPPAGSYLTPDLVKKPEAALVAVMRELRRSLEIIISSLHAARSYVCSTERQPMPKILASNENAINEIREATRSFLTRLTSRYLSRRQRLLAQYLTHITIDVERIGDHIEHLANSTTRQRRFPEAEYDSSMRQNLDELFNLSEGVLRATISSLNPDQAVFPEAAKKIEASRDQFAARSQTIRQAVNDRVANHGIPAIAGLFFSDQVLQFERLVRHCRMIAREEQQPYFSIKPKKLERVEPPAELKTPPSGESRKSKERG